MWTGTNEQATAEGLETDRRVPGGRFDRLLQRVRRRETGLSVDVHASRHDGLGRLRSPAPFRTVGS